MMIRSPGAPSRPKRILGGLFLAAAVLAAGCASNVVRPQATTTHVDLSRKNYELVRPNAIGSSYGFKLLGLVPIVSPTYAAAMSRLHSEAGHRNGKAEALINVNEERSSVYLVLFSVPTLTVRADVIEFTE